jgi:hypothetical protein
MRCPSCQVENPSQNRFCEQCGAPLATRCPQCHAPIGPSVRFCGACGHRLIGPGAGVPTHVSRPWVAADQSHFVAYSPTYLAEKILTSRSALEGERKQVTVLLADLKSSMELLADRDPEEARDGGRAPLRRHHSHSGLAPAGESLDLLQALHARIVEALEALAEERVAEQVERLAHHAMRGEVWDKALAYFQQAGKKAMARSAYREAVGSFEQALDDIAARRAPPQSNQAEAHYRQALAVLSTAVALYHDMKMSFWLPQAKAALAQGEES